MSIPSVSVVMPVFDGEPYLPAAVASILTQTHRDFELIAIDDGSTDASLSILKDFARTDSRVRVVSHENRGAIAAANEGLELARGEIVARMDADDISVPTRLERQLSYLRDNPEVVAVGCIALLIDAEGMPIAEAMKQITHEEIDESNLQGRAAINNGTAAMRRSALLQVGGYRNEFQAAEDIDLFLRLAEVGKLANLNEVLLHYRLHHKSVGHARSQVQRDWMIVAVESARQRRRLPPLAPGDIAVDATASRSDVHRKWAWWALEARNLKTARKHALHAARLDPFNPANFRLLACVARGR